MKQNRSYKHWAPNGAVRFLARSETLASYLLKVFAVVIGIGLLLISNTNHRSIAQNREVTFSKDVAPIVYEHCAACHRPDDIAPFSILDYQDAVTFKDAIKQKKHHVLYMSLGDAYQHQGKFDEAIAAYQKSIELKPEFAFSLYGLGYCLIKQGRYEEAIQPLQKLISVEPKSINGNHALGMAYARLGNKTAAMQQYYILENLDARAAADLLKAIPK